MWKARNSGDSKKRSPLVPGFLGFDHSGEITYFADRFIAGLRAAVETLVGRSMPVIPVAVPPIGSLKRRQDALLEGLARLDRPWPYTWHLVGHSTGGVDAALLLRAQRLAFTNDRGSFFSNEPLEAPAIASVTAVATPFYGTCISRAPVVEATRADATFAERIEGILGLPQLLLDAAQRDALRARLRFGAGAAGRTSGDFFYNLLVANRLLRDLDPEIVATLTATDNVALDAVKVFSIATLAPAPTAENTRDQLFALLYKWTALEADGAAPVAPPLPDPALRIAKQLTLLPAAANPIGPRENDGVVNTNRQVYGQFAAQVSADHGDVLGRYRRFDPFDAEPLDTGLLTSGAGFGDDEFFELLRAIAGGIAAAT